MDYNWSRFVYIDSQEVHHLVGFDVPNGTHQLMRLVRYRFYISSFIKVEIYEQFHVVCKIQIKLQERYTLRGECLKRSPHCLGDM